LIIQMSVDAVKLCGTNAAKPWSFGKGAAVARSVRLHWT